MASINWDAIIRELAKVYGAKIMKVHRIDHVGMVVNDLPAAITFFLDLGLIVLGETEVKRRVGGTDNWA